MQHRQPGYHGGRMERCTPPTYPWGGYGVLTVFCTWVYLPLLAIPRCTHCSCPSVLRWTTGSCTEVRRHRAQSGRNPWVREAAVPKVPKGVTVRRRECAELLRFLLREWMNDRVDEGSIPVYSPW